MTDEFSITSVNPDGSFTTQQAAGPVRFKDGQGQWQDIDLDLGADGSGALMPGSHPLDMSVGALAAGGKGRGVSVVHPGGGRQVVWQLPLSGDPQVEGNRAVYVDAWPGVDVAVEARRSGFEQTFLVQDRAAVDSLAGGERVEFRIPLLTKGLTARRGKDGVVEFVDAKGTVVSTVVAPVAFDAQVDERSGIPTSTTPVDLKVRPTAGKGRAEMVVSLDRAWMESPERVFPITVDPTYAAVSLKPTVDGYVQKAWPSSSSGATDDELLVGTYDGGGHVMRSYLSFDTVGLKGRQVMSAELSLWENHSYSCTPTTVAAHELSQPVTGTVAWSSMPSFTTTPAGQVDAAKGYSSTCTAGLVSIPVTATVQRWSEGTGGSRSLLVKAGSETSSSGWKRFDSSEGAHPPVLKYTYNRPPATPSVPVLSEGTSSVYTDPSTGKTTVWTSSARPRFEASTSDPDFNWAKLEFEVHSSTTPSASTLVASCTTSSARGGTVLGCTPGVDLADNRTYFVRARAVDSAGKTLSSGWSGMKTFYSSRSKPDTPVISCPDPYADGSWSDTAPGRDVSCTVSAASPTIWGRSSQITVQVDEGDPVTYPIRASSDTATASVTVTVPGKAGGHTIRATGTSRSGVESDQVTYSLGYGGAGLSAPVADPRPTVTGVVPVKAIAPPAASGQSVTAVVKYRTAGSAGDSQAGNWFTAEAPLQVSQSGGQSVASGNWDTAAASTNTNTGADPRVPVVLEIQVCFTYGGGATKCTGESEARSVFRVPHAFGDGFLTAEAGPGQVALRTGEFQTSVTDASVPGYSGDMVVGRSHATFGLPATTSQEVFGPGWVANLAGSEAGLADATLIDNTTLDGSLVLVDGTGEALVFDPPSSATGSYAARTGTYLELGFWLPGSQQTLDAGISARVRGSGTGRYVELTDLDGNVTVFKPSTLPQTGKAAVFTASSVAEAGVPGVTSFVWDAQGRVTRIIAPAPEVGTCPTTGTVSTKGCRVMDISYGTTTGGTDVAGQVKSISATLWDPANSTMKITTVASYAYDPATKRLTSVTDPRTGLKTTYSYDSQGRLTGLTPPGLTGFTLEYIGGTGTTPAQLTAVKRGGTQLSRFIYDINPTSPPAGMPALTAGVIAKWGQPADQAPTYAAAVFSADKPITATTAGSVAAADWPYAELSYTTARGYTVNTASYGAGQWQIEASVYDQHGNVVRSLDAGAIAKTGAFGSTGLEEGEAPWDAEQVQHLAELTQYNAQDITTADGTVLAPAGTLVTDQWGPARTSQVPGLGIVEGVRPHTVTRYDEGAPNGGLNPASGTGYNLTTSVTTTAADAQGTDLIDPATGAPVVLSKTMTSYDPIAPGTGSGWDFATPTKVTEGFAGTTTTTTTALDSQGRVIQERQPSEATTGDGPGTRATVYYTSGTNTQDSACGNAPQWAGLVCTQGPAATPTTGHPTERITSYNMWLAPAVTKETSNGATRTTTTTFDGAGRPVTSKLSATGLTGSDPVPSTRTTYSPATGLQAKIEAIDAGGAVTSSIGYAYDSWGRQTGYTNSQGEVTTTAYDAAGRVASVSDPNGSSTYAYDGVDAAGRSERRGLPTKVTHSSGGRSYEFTGAYDANGTLVEQGAPGGITQRWKTDAAGEPVEQFVSGPVTDPETGQKTTGAWLGWSLLNDPAGRVAVESTPAGAVLDGTDTTTGDGSSGVGDGYGYERSYSYDPVSRLTGVTDATATTSAGTVTTVPGQESAPAVCQQRTYGFDVNSNRTRSTSSDCAGQAATSTSWAYNAGDAQVTGADGQGSYVYDAFGRQTTIPKADTPTGAGDISIGYYDDDAAQMLVQGGVVTTFTRDAAGRRLVQDTSAWATTPEAESAVGSLERHYSDDSDNPAWVSFEGGSQRYLPGVGGDLGLQMTTRGGTATTELTVTNPHGDVVTTIPLGDGDTVMGISAWSDYTEYGTPRIPATTGRVEGAAGYGWVGGKERATPAGTFGLTLMGARLYNPVTGRFTTTDPVHGGNPNTYTYPVDPINLTDLNGLWSWGKRKLRSAKRFTSRRISWAVGDSRSARYTREACSWAPGLTGSACSGGYSLLYLKRGNKRAAGRWAASGALSAFGGNYANKALKSRHLFGSPPKLRKRGLFKASGRRVRFSQRRVAIYISSNLHGSAFSTFVMSFWR